MVKLYKLGLLLTGLICIIFGLFMFFRFETWHDGMLDVILGTVCLVGYIILDVISNMQIVTKVEVIKPDDVGVTIVNKN